jgi:hypothetical protein
VVKGDGRGGHLPAQHLASTWEQQQQQQRQTQQQQTQMGQQQCLDCTT